MENTFDGNFVRSRQDTIVKYEFPEMHRYYVAYLVDSISDYVHRVLMIV